MPVCMRGADPIIKEEVYQANAKSAEGYLAGILLTKAKEEGCTIQVNWKDQDSSSDKSFWCVYGGETSARLMKCWQLSCKCTETAQTTKGLSSGFIVMHKKDFPDVKVVKCNSKGRKHSTNCGCFTDSFIVSAHHNLYCSITQCSNDANKFATRMRELGKYHARGIYKWDDGECSFHPAQVCLCGNCNDKEKLKCLGKPYESRNVITCPMHFLAYEIECEGK